jgi:hypothetical protein
LESCQFGEWGFDGRTAMDGTATRTEMCPAFRSPMHILLPKVLTSRDNWKAKAGRRRHQLKLTRLTIRDLTRSRDAWRQRHRDQQQHIQRLDEQIEQLRRERDSALAAAAAAPKK